MRKSVVLALVLVLALAGATFAATPQFSGELEVSATSTGSFAGPFDVDYKSTLNLKFDEAGENWTANVGLAAVNLKTGGNISLANYKATFQGDGFDVAVARNQSVGGAKGDPFGFYSLSDYNARDNATHNHNRIRLNTSIVGQDVHAQLDTVDKALKLRTAGEADVFKWGVTAGVDLSGGNNSSFVFDGGFGLGIVDVYAAAGSVSGTTKWGIGAEAQVTEQLAVDAEYLYDNSWEVGASYTEGLLKASVGFDSTNAAEVEVRYRGDSDNVGFGDLFAKAHYWKNVAPAFGGKYETDGNKVTLNATAPLADNFAVLGNVTLAGGTSNINVDARYAVNDKFTISPYYKSANTNFGSDFAYAVGEDATIALNLDSEGGNQSSFVKFTVEF